MCVCIFSPRSDWFRRLLKVFDCESARKWLETDCVKRQLLLFFLAISIFLSSTCTLHSREGKKSEGENQDMPTLQNTCSTLLRQNHPCRPAFLGCSLLYVQTESDRYQVTNTWDADTWHRYISKDAFPVRSSFCSAVWTRRVSAPSAGPLFNSTFSHLSPGST